MKSPWKLLTLGAFVALSSVWAQSYDGPPPPKEDVPYLLHAENLIETETATARQEARKNETAYVISGASSSVRTPLAEPIFVMASANLQPQNLQLYAMDVKNGNRETAFPNKRNKRGPRPLYLSFKKLRDNLYWVEVNEYLDNGQYCLTPRGSNDVFCFEIY